MPSSHRPASRSLAIYESPAQARLVAWVQLAQAYHVVERRVVELLAGYDLTLPQFDLLATLLFNEGVSQQELARRLLVTKGNVVGMLDRLAAAGWVERRTDARDARANRLHLTPAGRRKIDRVLPRHDELIVEIFDCLADPDVLLLRRFCAALGRRDDGA